MRAKYVHAMPETSACSLHVVAHEQNRASSTLGRCGSGDIDGLDGIIDDCFDSSVYSSDKPSPVARCCRRCARHCDDWRSLGSLYAPSMGLHRDDGHSGSEWTFRNHYSDCGSSSLAGLVGNRHGRARYFVFVASARAQCVWRIATGLMSGIHSARAFVVNELHVFVLPSIYESRSPRSRRSIRAHPCKHRRNDATSSRLTRQAR